MAYATGRARHWWAPRNKCLDRHNFLMPPIRFTVVPELSPPHYNDEEPPPYSIVYHHGPEVLCHSSNEPPIIHLEPVNAGSRKDEAQPGPCCPPEPVLARGGQSPLWACSSSLVLSPSDYESLGARPRTSASAGRGSPRNNPASSPVSAPDYEPPPPYSFEDPYAPRTLANPRGNPRTAARGNHWDQLVDHSEAPPRPSAMASPTLPLDDPPPYNVAISCCPQVSPPALDSRPVVPLQPGPSGAAKAEVSPPPLLGAAAGGPKLEPVMEADELDLPPPSL